VQAAQEKTGAPSPCALVLAFARGDAGAQFGDAEGDMDIRCCNGNQSKFLVCLRQWPLSVRSQCRRRQAAECRHYRPLLHHRRRCSGMGHQFSAKPCTGKSHLALWLHQSGQVLQCTDRLSRNRSWSQYIQWRRRTQFRMVAPGTRRLQHQHLGFAERSPRRRTTGRLPNLYTEFAP